VDHKKIPDSKMPTFVNNKCFINLLLSNLKFSSSSRRTDLPNYLLLQSTSCTSASPTVIIVEIKFYFLITKLSLLLGQKVFIQNLSKFRKIVGSSGAG
jgi:hypothetical protein